MSVSVEWKTIFFKTFALTKKSYPYEMTAIPAGYIIDKKLVGLGYVNMVMKIRENWLVALSNFIHEDGGIFSKMLYLYDDKEKKQFNRCHSYYVDQIDMENKGGTNTNFMLEEILASLINHAENFDESNCESCRGENPLQTHLIQLL